MNNPLPQRRRIFIKKGFQGRFMLGAFAVILLSGLCSALLVYLIIGDELQAQALSAHAAISNAGERLGLSIMIGNAVSILLAGSIAVFSVLYASHKIAGPLYRFEKLCEEVGNGNLDTVARLRANDQLQELGQFFFSMVLKLRDKRDQRANLLDDIQALIVDLKMSDKLSVDDRKLLEELAEAAERLSRVDDRNVCE